MINTTKTKKFYAISFDNRAYNFVLDEYDRLFCDDIVQNKEIRKIYLKPNFEIFFQDGGYITCDSLSRAKNYKNEYQHLIGSYAITTDLLYDLVALGKISYSTEMAYLYNLDPNYARDIKTRSNAFKRVKKRTNEILTKQKQGIFN